MQARGFLEAGAFRRFSLFRAFDRRDKHHALARLVGGTPRDNKFHARSSRGQRGKFLLQPTRPILNRGCPNVYLRYFQFHAQPPARLMLITFMRTAAPVSTTRAAAPEEPTKTIL